MSGNSGSIFSNGWKREKRLDLQADMAHAKAAGGSEQ